MDDVKLMVGNLNASLDQLESRLSMVIGHLNVIWSEVSGAGEAVFSETVFQVQIEKEHLDVEKMREDMARDIHDREEKDVFDIALRHISLIACSLSILGMRAIMRGDREAAWSFATDAFAWLGHAMGYLAREKDSEASSIHKKGGEAMARRAEDLAKFAKSLADKGGYPSKRQAAKGIKDLVAAYAFKEYGFRISEQNAESTVTGYLTRTKFIPKAS